MNRNRVSLLLATALLGSVALVGCKKKEDVAPVTPPPAETAPATPAPTTPAPAPAATVSVTSVDLGTAVDAATNKVITPSAVFTPKDVINASVATVTSDPAATVAGTLVVKWKYQDGQVVNEEPRDISFTGSGNTNFSITKSDGWPKGKYTVEVSLNGAPVQNREFEVK